MLTSKPFVVLRLEGMKLGGLGLGGLGVEGLGLGGLRLGITSCGSTRGNRTSLSVRAISSSVRFCYWWLLSMRSDSAVNA
jgi:hypothetical protein